MARIEFYFFQRMHCVAAAVATTIANVTEIHLNLLQQLVSVN